MFTKGHKLAKGGARSGSGPKPKKTKDIHAQFFGPDSELVRLAVEKLQALVEQDDPDAVKYTLDRAFGKAKQAIDLGGSGELRLTVRYADAPVIASSQGS